MEILIASLILIGLCVVGLCFNIIFRKDGQFPQTEIEHNVQMRKRGIRCAKEDEMKLWGRKRNRSVPECSDAGCSDCTSCGC